MYYLWNYILMILYIVYLEKQMNKIKHKNKRVMWPISPSLLDQSIKLFCFFESVNTWRPRLFSSMTPNFVYYPISLEYLPLLSLWLHTLIEQFLIPSRLPFLSPRIQDIMLSHWSPESFSPDLIPYRLWWFWMTPTIHQGQLIHLAQYLGLTILSETHTNVLIS